MTLQSTTLSTALFPFLLFPYDRLGAERDQAKATAVRIALRHTLTNASSKSITLTDAFSTESRYVRYGPLLLVTPTLAFNSFLPCNSGICPSVCTEGNSYVRL